MELDDLSSSDFYGTLAVKLAPDDTTIALDDLSDLPGPVFVGAWLKIGPIATATEYVLVTDVDATSNRVSVVRNTAPPCLKSIATTITIPAGTSGVLMLLGLGTFGTSASSNSMISTSMRAIVELSPREPIEWIVPVVTSSRLVRDIIMQGLTLEDFASPSARRATTQEYQEVLARLLEINPSSETLTVSNPRGNVTVTVELVCDSAAVCNEKWAKLEKLICNGELAKELKDLFKKDVKIDGKLNGCPNDTKPDEGNLLLLLLLLLLLIPLGIAAYYCTRKEKMPPTGKPMAPVYLPQPYPVLPVEYAPVAAPMPVMQMSPQPVAIEYAPMQMSPQPVMMMPMNGSPVPYGMQQPPMQYGM